MSCDIDRFGLKQSTPFTLIRTSPILTPASSAWLPCVERIYTDVQRESDGHGGGNEWEYEVRDARFALSVIPGSINVTVMGGRPAEYSMPNACVLFDRRVI